MHGDRAPKHRVGDPAWHKAYPRARIDGMTESMAFARYPETAHSYNKRFEDTFHRLSKKHPGKHVLLVSHGYMVIATSWIGGMAVDSCDYCAVNQLVPDTDRKGRSRWLCRVLADTSYNGLA